LKKTKGGAGRNDEIHAGIDKFVADFNGQPYEGLSLRSMAKQYYEKAMRLRQAGDVGRADENFRGAKRIYGRIIESFDENSPDMPVAYYYSGRMCQLLRDYACAAANFEVVVEGWADCRLAFEAIPFKKTGVYCSK